MRRKLERIHAAVVGSFRRHGHVLPLEMYLEEGLPLVCYLRSQPHAEMVELPEQSCHFFMSWSNAAATTPSLKVTMGNCHLLMQRLLFLQQVPSSAGNRCCRQCL